MTGWRIGFLMGPRVLIAEAKKVHQYLVTAATTIAQRAGIEALTNGQSLATEQKLALISGTAFGPGGEGYIRISYAASMADLKEAVKRLQAFIAAHKAA